MFFEDFRLSKMGFYAVFNWVSVVFESYAYPFGFFGTLKVMKKSPFPYFKNFTFSNL